MKRHVHHVVREIKKQEFLVRHRSYVKMKLEIKVPGEMHLCSKIKSFIQACFDKTKSIQLKAPVAIGSMVDQ